MRLHKTVIATMISASLVFGATGVASAVEIPGRLSSISAQQIDDIDFDAVKRVFEQEMIAHEKYNEYQELQQTLKGIKEERGPKGAAAKAAIKAAVKAMKGIGEKAWNATINKLPLPQSVKKYLGYQTVMKALDIATGFEGKIKDMINNALKSVGIPSWAAGIAARAIVFVLL